MYFISVLECLTEPTWYIFSSVLGFTCYWSYSSVYCFSIYNIPSNYTNFSPKGNSAAVSKLKTKLFYKISSWILEKKNLEKKNQIFYFYQENKVESFENYTDFFSRSLDIFWLGCIKWFPKSSNLGLKLETCLAKGLRTIRQEGIII